MGGCPSAVSMLDYAQKLMIKNPGLDKFLGQLPKCRSAAAAAAADCS
jgi:hypothetical protein